MPLKWQIKNWTIIDHENFLGHLQKDNPNLSIKNVDQFP